MSYVPRVRGLFVSRRGSNVRCRRPGGSVPVSRSGSTVFCIHTFAPRSAFVAGEKAVEMGQPASKGTPVWQGNFPTGVFAQALRRDHLL